MTPRLVTAVAVLAATLFTAVSPHAGTARPSTAETSTAETSTAGAALRTAPGESREEGPATVRVAHRLGRSAAAAWSADRMRRAAARNPVLGEATAHRWAGAGSVGRTTGRVFFRMAGDDYSCSASTVASANRDVVVTAAHCVFAGQWAREWVFVPGYDHGRHPFGVYPARSFHLSQGWLRRADDAYDIAMVTVAAPGGRHVADLVGAQRIAFGRPPSGRIHAFGYPARPPYTGDSLHFCAGDTLADPYARPGRAGLPCTMTAGASGGPWLADFDPRTGAGVVVSVSSFKYTSQNLVMFGPYFGSTAEALYQQAQHE